MKTLLSRWNQQSCSNNFYGLYYRRNIVTENAGLNGQAAGEILYVDNHYSCLVWRNDGNALSESIPVLPWFSIEETMVTIDKILLQMGYYINDRAIVMI